MRREFASTKLRCIGADLCDPMAESCHAESDMHSSTEEAKGKEAEPARLHSRLELSRSLTPADEAPRSARLEAKVAAAAAELCRLNALLGC